MCDGVTLLYLGSRYIVDFVAQNPVEWKEAVLAKRGGPGDSAGPTPTPAVYEFLRLLRIKKALFTQAEFACHCISRWRDWYQNLSRLQKEGIEAKLYRNFYPSMIDSLHVWAMLSETGAFDRCILDSFDDATAKSDLTLIAGDREIKVALLAGSKAAVEDRRYKLTYRGGGTGEVFEVVLPLEREKGPGNKRWYRLEDFMPVLPAGYRFQFNRAGEPSCLSS